MTDCDGNRLSNQPRYTTRFEHLIALMKAKCLDVYIMQDTWLEDDKFDIDIGGYHVFCHNGPNGNHLHHGVAIVLSPRYYAGWRAAGAAPPVTTNTASEFVGLSLGSRSNWKSATREDALSKARRRNKCHSYYHWYWLITHAVPRMTTRDFLILLTPSLANYHQARLLWVPT